MVAEMSFARVEHGLVLEIIPAVAQGVPLAERFSADFVAAMVSVSAEVQVGWLWDGATATPPPPAQDVSPVPQTVALWQFRRELQMRGWWAAVQAAIAALPAEQRADAEEWLEYGTEVRRDAPLLLALAEALGLTEELDDAFRAAAARSL